MRKNVTKVAAALLSAAMVVTSVSVPGTTSEAASVKISAKKATIYAGPAKKTVALTVKKGSTNLTKKCKWTSSNKKVATVGAKTGKVTAKKKGTATITAKYGKKSYKCKVTVKAYKYATKLTVSPTSKSLTVGKTQKITVKYTGAPTTTGVTFKSNNTAVASVSSKGVITAKKAGTAKITVSTKKNVAKKTLTKTITVTVKAASTATASPSAAPASEAPASAAPSEAPSAAPASAAPVSTASAAPTAEPSKEPSRVSEIKITSESAYTDPDDANTAYIYYDVLDQYGKSMRASADINWVTSPAGGKANKSNGMITVTKSNNKTEKFNYGDLLYVTGVHAKTGTTVQQQVKVGLEEAVNSIKVAGFVSKDDKTKIVKTLPANFAKGTWYMVFQTYNRDGNLLDMTKTNKFREKNLTFVSNDPMKIATEVDEADTPIFTITNTDGTTTDYASIRVEPQMYVDRGGEVQMTAISNRTGNKTDFIVNIGESSQLKSLELKVPSDRVADGDTVELEYEAMDMKGNKVTSYETIVRSSNSLQMNATEGTLTISEKNDGTAKITWADASKYNPKDPETYKGLADGVNRRVMLLSTVIGGEMKQTELQVEDIRIPAEITATGLSSVIANGGSETVNPLDASDKFKYKDQYGKAMDKAVVDAFFKKASVDGYGYGSDLYLYGVKVEAPTNAKLIAGEASKVVQNGGNVTLAVDDADVYDKNDKAYKAIEETYKFSVATIGKNEKDEDKKVVSNWNTGKVFSQTITGAPVSAVSDFAVADLKALIQVSATKKDKGETEKDDIMNVTFAGTPTYKVVGKYKGNDVSIPSQWILEGYGSKFNGSKVDGDSYKLNVGTFVESGTAIKKSALYNFSVYGNPAKNGSFEKVLAVTNEKTLKTEGFAGKFATAKEDLANATSRKSLSALKSDVDTKLADLKDKIVANGENTDKKIAVSTAFENFKKEIGSALGVNGANLDAQLKALTDVIGTDGKTDIYNDFKAVSNVVGTAEANSELTKGGFGLIGSVAGAGWDSSANVRTAAKSLRDAILGTEGVINTNPEGYLYKAYQVYQAYVTLKTANEGDSKLGDVESAYAKLTGADKYVGTDGKESQDLKDFEKALDALTKNTANVTAVKTNLSHAFSSSYVNNLGKYNLVKAAIDKWVADGTKITNSGDVEKNVGDVKDCTDEGNALKTAIEAYVKAFNADIELKDLTTTIDTIRKDVIVNPTNPYAAKITMDAKATLNPVDTELGTDDTQDKAEGKTHKGTGKIFVSGKDAVTNKILVNVYDQYGDNFDPKLEKVVYTVSLTKENKGDFAHKDGGIEIKKNGTEAPEIIGAELGDTFTITAQVKGTSLTAKCDLTIGADQMAFIADKGDNNKSDESFRQNCLGYVK